MRTTASQPQAAPSGPALRTLAMGVRARRLRGLDVLGRRPDRAPPGR